MLLGRHARAGNCLGTLLRVGFIGLIAWYQLTDGGGPHRFALSSQAQGSGLLMPALSKIPNTS